VTSGGQVRVSADSGGGLSAGVAVPISTVRLTPGGTFRQMAGRPADFVVDKASQVVNTNDIDPSTVHLTWKGPRDLSAACWVGRDGDALLLRFDVTDDRHRQPYHGSELWKGDAVQAAVAVPGRDGHLEFAVARGDDGRAVNHVWLAPKGTTGREAHQRIEVKIDDLPGKGGGEGGGLSYQVRIPFDVLKLDDATLGRGVRLSFVAHDLDEDRQGAAREGWIQLSEGIAREKDTAYFPMVRLVPAVPGRQGAGGE